MNNKFVITGAFLILFAIILGAMAAHAIEDHVSTKLLVAFEKGVKYQMYHALMLLFVGINATLSIQKKQIIFVLVLVGILFFSGSIYGLSTNELSSFNFKKIGFITPIGGVLLITAWLVMLIGFVKNKSE